MIVRGWWVSIMSKVQEDKFQIPGGHLFDEDNAWCVDESYAMYQQPTTINHSL